jgi:hypothetical protein
MRAKKNTLQRSQTHLKLGVWWSANHESKLEDIILIDLFSVVERECVLKRGKAKSCAVPFA